MDVLSLSYKHKITTWLSTKDKPLFIIGEDGTGKTTLAKDILKDHHIIHINSEHLKYKRDLKDYITNSLFKKDILMMCSSNNHYKALLLDDLQLFVSYDKSNLKDIYKFLKGYSYTHNPIIVICNTVHNKYINLIKELSVVIDIGYNPLLYKKIAKKIATQKSKNITNLHSVKLRSQGYDIHNDEQYKLLDLLPILFSSKKDISDVFTLCSSEYTILSLNMLENLPNIMKHGYLTNLYALYETICIGDYIESKYIDKHIDSDILIYFNCVYPYYICNDCISNTGTYKFTYNSYISKSLIQIHNQNILDLSDINYLYILQQLYNNYYLDTNKEVSYILKDKQFDKKVLEKQMKVFNYYYNKTMTKKQLLYMMKQL